LAMSPDGTGVGTLYGIGTYRDPGECRGNTLRPVLHRFNQGREEFFYGRGREDFSESFYLPSGSGFVDHPWSVSLPRQALGAIPDWVACTPAQLMEPPPPAPGALDAPGWQPAARPAAADMNRIMPAAATLSPRGGLPESSCVREMKFSY
ncbi:MAG: hypothetical protein ACO3YS_06785, partial [Burkholderiaceae bacterium]